MKQLIIYRDKETNKYTSIDESRSAITPEMISNYNNSERSATYAELLEVEETDLIYWLAQGYKASIKDWHEKWGDVLDALESIERTVDNIRCDCEKILEVEK